MKIIAVNISRNLHAVPTILDATKRAWLLNQKKVVDENFEYVIGVSNGGIQGYFKLQKVFIDGRQPNRVAFDLTACNNREQRIINTALTNVNLSHFVTKYIEV